MPQDHDGQVPQKIGKLRDVMYSRSLSPLIHDRERRLLSRDPDMVQHDWQREEPHLEQIITAPRGITIVRTMLLWLVAGAILFFIGAAVYFVYYFMYGGGSVGTSARNVDIAITGPTEVAGGNKTELQIAITNHNTSALEDAELVVTYPPGTRSAVDFSSAQPQWIQPLGTLNPGEVRRGVANAVFNGVQGDSGVVKIEIKYHLADSNAQFVASNQYAFVYGSTPLSIVMSGNTRTVSGQPIELTATISSNVSIPIKGVNVAIHVPFGFKVNSIHPAVDQQSMVELGDLDPGEQKQIVIDGTLTGSEGDDRIVTLVAGTLMGATSTTVDVPLATQEYAISIEKSFLGLSLSAGDIQASQGISSLVIQPGQKVTTTITYTNNLSTPVTNATIIARFAGYQIDGATITTPDGFYRSNDGTIIWNKTTSSQLAEIQPGGTGTLTFTFIAPTLTELQGKGASNISVALSAAATRVSDTGAIQSLQSITDQSFTIAGNVTLATNGLYYSSPYGATGPMPPKVGLETTYAVVLTLTNSTNPITNVQVSGMLPVYVRATGKSSPSYEKLHFNQQTGAVSWDVGDLAANVGVNGTQSRQVAFEVGFTPSISQIGQKPLLFKDIVLTGTDSVTGQQVYLSSTSSEQVQDVSIDLRGDATPSNLNPAVVDNPNPSDNI